MIGFLRGILLEKNAPQVLLEVAGVGYEVELPTSSFHVLPVLGDKTALYTHFVVREDAQLLYGFLNRQDRVLFRILIKVNGIGPKLALNILSNTGVADFVYKVQAQDVNGLMQLPGVGRKMAERLVIELKSHVENWCVASEGSKQLESLEKIGGHHGATGIVQDAITALVSLGYKPYVASQVISKVKNQAEAETSEGLIRLALQSIGG